MNTHLIVVQAFAGHARGDVINDPIRVAEILGSELARFVVPVSTPAAKGA